MVRLRPCVIIGDLKIMGDSSVGDLEWIIQLGWEIKV